MKTVLVVAATLGISASAAYAECAGHSKVTAEVDVDKTLTTASVVTTTEKQSRLPSESDALVIEEPKDAAVAE